MIFWIIIQVLKTKSRNQFLFNSKFPPIYDIKHVTNKFTCLFHGKNDWFTSDEDSNIIRNELIVKLYVDKRIEMMIGIIWISYLERIADILLILMSLTLLPVVILMEPVQKRVKYSECKLYWDIWTEFIRFSGTPGITRKIFRLIGVSCSRFPANQNLPFKIPHPNFWESDPLFQPFFFLIFTEFHAFWGSR